ncbi:MAG TPA: hypothetical protein VKG43_10880 [Acidimicrobiales bacterium]|nr:hypothetical protein [Acidimicrobiales bacterium]
MIVTRITMIAGVVVLAGLVVLTSIGFTAMLGPLVTVFVLVLLIAGGSWLGGRSGAPPAPHAGEDDQ